MTSADKGVASLEFSEIPIPRSGGKRPNQPVEPEGVDSPGPNNQEEEDNDTLCTALLETNMVRDNRDAQLIMESR